MMTLNEHMKRFPDEEACKRFLFECRWPDGVVRCPRCDNENVHPVRKKPWHWQCRRCSKTGYRFSITSRTIFDNAKYRLRTFFQVLYLMLQSKKGISANQIHRMIGSGSYRTAWFMCHRLRAAMRSGEFIKVAGQVEIDETFVGNKAENMHKRRRKALALVGRKGKVAVIGAIARKGNVVAQVIENTDTPTLDRFARKTVADKVTQLLPDKYKQGLIKGVS